MAERAPPQPTLPLRKNSRPGRLPSRWNWARGGITSFERAYCQGHHPINPYIKSPFPAGHGSFREPKVTATKKTARPQKNEPKTTAGLKVATEKSKKPRVSKPQPLNPLTPTWWFQTKVRRPHSRKFLISITFPSCMCGAESSAPHIHLLPTGAAHPRAVLKNVILCDQIWHHAFGRSERHSCASPAGTRSARQVA